MMVVVDMGAQICILPENKVVSLSMKLFKVSTRVIGATLESQLDVRGGAFLEVSNPSGTHLTRTVQMFYVARNVDRCYLSLSCLKALHVVPAAFPEPSNVNPRTPRIQESSDGAAVKPRGGLPQVGEEWLPLDPDARPQPP